MAFDANPIMKSNKEDCSFIILFVFVQFVFTPKISSLFLYLSKQ